MNLWRWIRWDMPQYASGLPPRPAPSCFILLIPALFYHALIGMEEIIEDYLAPGWRKTAAMTLARFGAALCALASMLAVLAVTMGM